AKNLPVADIGTLSCDPYVLASIVVADNPEPLKFRTPTIHRTRDPTWNARWLVAGVPAAGFKLVMVLYDEDPGAKLSSDRLGKAVARFGPDQMAEGFESREQEYVLQKRKGDLHPYILTYLTALLPGEKLVKHNRVIVSVRVLRRDEQTDDLRMYTLGPSKRVCLLPNRISLPQTGAALSATTFIANKLQLTGPVPRALRHRYVGYKPFINWMFDDTGVAGRILHRGLKKQYRTVYACDKATVWGVVDDTGEREREEAEAGLGEAKDSERDSDALARQFLDMAAWGERGKLFTYVITLDGEWRFTETGPEFAIDLLSKHSMHADLAKEVAYSGEFFVRRMPVEAGGRDGEREKAGKEKSDKPNVDDTQAPNDTETSNPDSAPTRNTKAYELIIDNDSGTYRPKKELLPVLEVWLSSPRALGALGRVSAMDGFDDALKEMKEERKNDKKGKGGETKVGKMVGVRKGGSGSVSRVSSGKVGE
ncbi:hypothetical protein B0H10DRAFT_1819115, partial [Mycena sp. CBHHK59/15]